MISLLNINCCPELRCSEAYFAGASERLVFSFLFVCLFCFAILDYDEGSQAGESRKSATRGRFRVPTLHERLLRMNERLLTKNSP